MSKERWPLTDEELVRGRPHPSDHLDRLAALRDDLDADDER